MAGDLTWRAHDVPRMESVRVQLSGNRIKAYGRIVAAATSSHPAFSASYDLVTDEAGATKRLSLTVTLAERERNCPSPGTRRTCGWFSSTPARRVARLRRRAGRRCDLQPVLQRAADPPDRAVSAKRPVIPVVYVRLPELSVEAATISYSSAADGIKLHSPVAETTVTVDSNGFILDYPGLAERI